ARLIKCSLQSDISTVQARILGTDVTDKLGAPGRHLVINSLGVLAAAALVGADLALAALALADLHPASGRGSRLTLHMPGGTALLIDESYNANPASMRAALALLGQADVGPLSRRIAVLGDMLELGPRGAELHRELAVAALAHGIDLVFCCGPLMQALWEALPSSRKGGYAETAAALEPQVLAAVQADDALMVKGSLGSRMTPIVKALQSRYLRETPGLAPAQASTINRSPMPYWLSAFSDTIGPLNVLRYITFRTGGAMFTALVFVFLFGHSIIDQLRLKQGKGQPIRSDGPQSHLVTKKGTPTMGGLMMLFGLVVSTVLWANLTNRYVWIVLGVTLIFGAIGFYDDYLKVTKQTHAGVSGKVRMLIEALVAVVACYFIVSLGRQPFASSLTFP